MVEQLLVGLGLTLIFTPALIFMSALLKLYEYPNERLIISHPVPTAGGLGCTLLFMTAYWYRHPICWLIWLSDDHCPDRAGR